MDKLVENKRETAYRGTTHIGKSGLEAYYEEQLHGAPGYQEVEKDAAGNIVRVIRSDPSQRANAAFGDGYSFAKRS